MKRLLAFWMLSGILLSAFSGCGSSKETENKAAQNNKKTINEILAESQAKESATAGETSIHYPALDYTAEVDLTALNANMTYSTVYDMVSNRDAYLNKTVKANGTFDVFTNPDTGELFYSCIIADATACCSQGLEFRLENEGTYPDDYPKIGDPITVGGTYAAYEEDGKTYCRLINAKLAV